MEFHGKLYGKIGGTYFDTGKTTIDYDRLVEALKEALNVFDTENIHGKTRKIIENAIKEATK